MVGEARRSHGRTERTSFCIVDAQSVKNTDSAENKGYDAGKKVSGIKRHIAVDTQGLPHAIHVAFICVAGKVQKAVEELRKETQYQLANMYELGTGVSQNLKKAIYWYKKSDEFGYYLAKAKVIRLQKLLKTGGSIKRNTTSQAVTKAKKAPSPLIQTITNGQWFKRKKAAGYLPSNITNCVNDSYNSLHCISTSQERSTGSEIITYNTESNITIKNKTSFDIIYTNNVLKVTTLAVEDGDGDIIEQSPSRIKKGKQSKKRKLVCHIKGKNSISCTKGSSSFNLTSR